MIVSHDRAFLDRTITSVLELDDHTSHRRRSTRAAGRRISTERATARRHAEEEYAGVPRASGSELVDRARRQREWSVQGKAKVQAVGETDKFIRHFRRNSSEHVAAKAKITDRALDRLEPNAIDKPWEGWDLRMEIATAPRGGAVVRLSRRRGRRRGDFTLGPLDRPGRLRRTRRDPRSQRQRQDHAARRPPRPTAPSTRRACASARA